MSQLSSIFIEYHVSTSGVGQSWTSHVGGIEARISGEVNKWETAQE